MSRETSTNSRRLKSLGICVLVAGLTGGLASCGDQSDGAATTTAVGSAESPHSASASTAPGSTHPAPAASATGAGTASTPSASSAARPTGTSSAATGLGRGTGIAPDGPLAGASCVLDLPVLTGDHLETLQVGRSAVATVTRSAALPVTARLAAQAGSLAPRIQGLVLVDGQGRNRFLVEAPGAAGAAGSARTHPTSSVDGAARSVSTAPVVDQPVAVDLRHAVGLRATVDLTGARKGRLFVLDDQGQLSAIDLAPVSASQHAPVTGAAPRLLAAGLGGAVLLAGTATDAYLVQNGLLLRITDTGAGTGKLTVVPVDGGLPDHVVALLPASCSGAPSLPAAWAAVTTDGRVRWFAATQDSTEGASAAEQTPAPTSVPPTSVPSTGATPVAPAHLAAAGTSPAGAFAGIAVG